MELQQDQRARRIVAIYDLKIGEDRFPALYDDDDPKQGEEIRIVLAGLETDAVPALPLLSPEIMQSVVAFVRWAESDEPDSIISEAKRIAAQAAALELVAA